MTSAKGHRVVSISSMSRIAAPVALAMSATRRGYFGNGFLRFGSK